MPSQDVAARRAHDADDEPADAELTGDGHHEVLNLKQVARRLDVHYMTAYRYVRQGVLPAWRDGNMWLVDVVDVDAMATQRQLRAAGRASAPATADGRVDWVERLRGRLINGDEVGAWQVTAEALAAGHSAQRCYLELISGAVGSVGVEVELGSLTSADEHLATVTAKRVAGRLGARFQRPGRARGTVVLGAPAGERHALPIAIVADVVRLAGFGVLELGADVPPEAFVTAAARADRLVAVGVGATTVDYLDAVVEVVRAVRQELPDVPILAGGQAVRSPEIAGLLGVTDWAPDGAGVVEAVEKLVL